MKNHKIHFPQEVDVWYVLPALRKKIALGLLGTGMSQKEVAGIMKTSEATISHYKKDKRVKTDLLGNTLDAEIALSIKRIQKNSAILFSEILKLSNIVKEKGIFCDLYGKMATVHQSKRPCNDCYSSSTKLCVTK